MKGIVKPGDIVHAPVSPEYARRVPDNPVTIISNYLDWSLLHINGLVVGVLPPDKLGNTYVLVLCERGLGWFMKAVLERVPP